MNYKPTKLMPVFIFIILCIWGLVRYVPSYEWDKEKDMSRNLIEKVEVGLSYTINAGNYQSVRVHLGVTRFVEEGESTKEVIQGLREEVRKELMIAGEEELAEFKKATSKRR